MPGLGLCSSLASAWPPVCWGQFRFGWCTISEMPRLVCWPVVAMISALKEVGTGTVDQSNALPIAGIGQWPSLLGLWVADRQT